MITPAGLMIPTAYGEGKLVGYRNDDSMYIVEFQSFSATLYTRNVDLSLHTTATKAKESPAPLLKDSNGRPLFPILHNLRLESKELIGQSSQQIVAAKSNVSKQISSNTASANAKLHKLRLESQELIGQSSKQMAAAKLNVSKQISKTSRQMAAVTSNASKKISKMVKSSQEEQQFVQTAYGSPALVLEFRPSDNMYVVKLPFGATLYTRDVKLIKDKKRNALELNAAYETSEKTRHEFLELECAKAGIPFTEDTASKCFACLKKANESPKQGVSSKSAILSNSNGQPLFPKLYKFRLDSQELIQKSSEQVAKKKELSPCLLCGSNTCSEHASAAFRKEGIMVCTTCVEHLEYDFESAHTPEDLEKQVKHLVDLYGRALLLLQYSSQFMLRTADLLEQNTKQHNQVGVGSSSVGLVSGALGVAAACSLLTPAGPPLLVASLVFGGSATAVQTGSEAMKYYSEPNQLANRILALQGMVKSIIATTDRMRATTLLPYLDLAISSLEAVPHDNSTKETAVLTGTRVGGSAATSMASFAVQETVVAGRFASRATTAAARTARFARFAGGALSAAVVVLEARELKKTIEQIHKGNPCEKAKSLREIHANLNDLPSKTSVEGMCRSYVKVRSKHLLKQTMSEFAVKSQDDYLALVEEVVISLEAATQDNVSVLPVKCSGKPSLLERVRQCKKREAEQNKVESKTESTARQEQTEPKVQLKARPEADPDVERNAEQKADPDWLVL